MQKQLPGCPGDPGLKFNEITLEIKFKMLKKSNFTCPGEPLFPGGPSGPGPPNKWRSFKWEMWIIFMAYQVVQGV